MLINQQKLHLNPLLSVSEEQRLSNSSIHSSSGNSLPEQRWLRAVSIFVALAKGWKTTGSEWKVLVLSRLSESCRRGEILNEVLFLIWVVVLTSIVSGKRFIQRARFEVVVGLDFYFEGLYKYIKYLNPWRYLPFDPKSASENENRKPFYPSVNGAALRNLGWSLLRASETNMTPVHTVTSTPEWVMCPGHCEVGSEVSQRTPPSSRSAVLGPLPGGRRPGFQLIEGSSGKNGWLILQLYL